jgi:hypothetical protein
LAGSTRAGQVVESGVLAQAADDGDAEFDQRFEEGRLGVGAVHHDPERCAEGFQPEDGPLDQFDG